MNIKPHPTGFSTRTGKIHLDDNRLIEGDLTGDKVCAKYYEDALAKIAKVRAKAFAGQKGFRGKWIPEFATPYTLYPSLASWFIKVPVEAVLGEPYMPQTDGGRLAAVPGCYIGCQDIRKTLEWVMAAKLGQKITWQVRLRFFFSFECPEGYFARPTKRDSWREPETEEEFNIAVALLKSFGKKADFSKFLDYDLMLKGETGEITGCECYIPTEKERYDGIRELTMNRTRGRKHKASTAREMTRKKTRQTYNRSCPENRGLSEGAGTSESNNREFDESILDDFDSCFPRGTSFPEEEEFEDIQIDELEEVPGEIVCHDYNYPEFEVGTTLPADQQAAPDPESVAAASALLQASLHRYLADLEAMIDFDLAGSSKGSPGKHAP